MSSPPVEGANNVGEVSRAPLSARTGLEEGSDISKALNAVPGINAVAGLHDVMQNTWTALGGNTLRTGLNHLGMLPAAAITYTGLAADYVQTGIIIDNTRRQ